MSKTALDAFYLKATSEPELRRKLEAAPDEVFARVAVELARQAGFHFTEEEFDAALKPASDLLTDAQLEQVVGGAGTTFKIGRNTAASFGTIGCFTAGTRILLADGSDQPIESLLLGVARVKRPWGTDALAVSGISGPENLPIVRIQTASGQSVGVTEMHPMVVEAGGQYTVVAARDLSVGDSLWVWGSNLSPCTSTLVSIERPMFSGLVYNFHLQGDSNPAAHFLVANGILTGDLFLQELLETKAKGQRTTAQALTPVVRSSVLTPSA